MKFKIEWAVDQDKWLDVLQAWASMTPEQRADGGPGAKIIGRWHDLASRTGVLIMETDSVEALHRYAAQWNPHMELDVAPVVDDEESAVLAKEMVAAHSG